MADFLLVRGEKYCFAGPRDMTAIKALAAVASDDEIRRRWVVSLSTSNRFLRCNNIGQLRVKFNDLAGATREAMRHE